MVRASTHPTAWAMCGGRFLLAAWRGAGMAGRAGIARRIAGAVGRGMAARAGMLILGVDGGGSGCRAAVADGAGRVLGRGEAGPANIHSDPEGGHDAILAAALEAARAAGVAPGRLCAVLGLAGANMPQAVARLAPALPFARARILSDAQTATRGAIGTGEGIVAAMGTGSVFAVQAGGRFAQFGGRGWILGDEGGGAPLGRAALAEALRAEDGFAQPSPFLSELVAEQGGAAGVIGFAAGARAPDFAALAPRLVAAADAGDAGAGRVLGRAADRVGAILASLQGRFGALPVVFLGGLGPAYAARLSGRFAIRPAQGGALDGALALARELAEAGA